MQVTPDKYRPGDRFLHIGGGGVYILLGFGEETNSTSIYLELVDGGFVYGDSFSTDQPQFVQVPEGATDEQLQALRRILIK